MIYFKKNTRLSNANDESTFCFPFDYLYYWELSRAQDKVMEGLRIKEALGNMREHSSPRPYFFGFNGFDADR